MFGGDVLTSRYGRSWMRFVTKDGRLPSSMAVRTPPVHIYTSTLHRRQRAWGRGRDRARALDLAALGFSLLVVAVLVVAVLAPTAS
ncbi:MAG: hypothetical protein QOJ55_299 [Solirubrobacteraceae bacterium]|nr:hypothetical protein [Solirubrobacteraceae bacterium]